MKVYLASLLWFIVRIITTFSNCVPMLSVLTTVFKITKKVSLVTLVCVYTQIYEALEEKCLIAFRV